MPNPRRNWRRAWRVDLPAGAAVHQDTGARVRYTNGPPDPAGTENHLGVSASLENGAAVLADLSQQHGAAAAEQILRRLIREAIEMHGIVARRVQREAQQAPGAPRQ